MRRSDRAMTRKEALANLADGEYGIISTVDQNNQPYGVPVNFCLIDTNIYFHCALKGQKIDNFAYNPKVSFCVVGDTLVLPSEFSTKYHCTIVFGKISEAFSSEKQKALEGLLKKYSNDFFSNGLKHIESKREKTRVFKINIIEITGKHGK